MGSAIYPLKNWNPQTSKFLWEQTCMYVAQKVPQNLLQRHRQIWRVNSFFKSCNYVNFAKICFGKRYHFHLTWTWNSSWNPSLQIYARHRTFVRQIWGFDWRMRKSDRTCWPGSSVMMWDIKDTILSSFFCPTKLAACPVKPCPWPDIWRTYRTKNTYRLEISQIY